jgi:hypothetical protein
MGIIIVPCMKPGGRIAVVKNSDSGEPEGNGPKEK